MVTCGWCSRTADVSVTGGAYPSYTTLRACFLHETDAVDTAKYWFTSQTHGFVVRYERTVTWYTPRRYGPEGWAIEHKEIQVLCATVALKSVRAVGWQLCLDANGRSAIGDTK